jgi:hypothetical protein
MGAEIGFSASIILPLCWILGEDMGHHGEEMSQKGYFCSSTRMAASFCQVSLGL